MPIFNKIKLGVRSKIFTASLIISLMLVLSGAMAFFEFGRMSRYISDFISNSILTLLYIPAAFSNHYLFIVNSAQ